MKQETFRFVDLLHGVDWTETCCKVYLLFISACFVVTFLSIYFKKSNLQILLFFSFLMPVYFSEWINKWASLNYRLFSKHGYFDSHGMFISIFFSSPLLVLSSAIVVSWVVSSAGLLINVKKKELMQAHKKTN